MSHSNETQELLRLGLKDGRIVSISDVENGLKCKCYCPCCGQPLVAKNNPTNKKVAHFAHYGDFECSNAIETALHKLAKEILLEERNLFIPDYVRTGIKGPAAYIKKRLITFDDVVLEKKVLTNETFVIADAIGTFKTRTLLVEFAKTHFVDEAKEKKLRLSDYACVEIDLRGMEQSREAVRAVLLMGTERVKWISNPEGDRLFQLHEEEVKRQMENEMQALRARQEEERLAAQKRKEQEAKEIAIRWKDYKAKGYYFITEKADDSFFCPGRKLIKEGFSQTAYGRHEVIQEILKGQKWNGKFYGFFPDPKYIYVGETIVEVFPVGGIYTDSKEEGQCKFLFKCLKKYKALQKVLSGRPCVNCKFFKERHGNTTVCSFNVQKGVENIDFFNYNAMEDVEESLWFKKYH